MHAVVVVAPEDVRLSGYSYPLKFVLLIEEAFLGVVVECRSWGVLDSVLHAVLVILLPTSCCQSRDSLRQSRSRY